LTALTPQIWVWEIHVCGVDTGTLSKACVQDTDATIFFDFVDETDMCDGIVIQPAVAISVDGRVPKDDITGARESSV
tara:strand:+ start:732 stop:962 length:231 start_codon:yes stop_codon:yes gene_type:complete